MWGRLGVRGRVCGGGGGWDSGLASLLLGPPRAAPQHRTPRSKVQKPFSTSSVLSTEADKSTASKDSTTEGTSKKQEGTAGTPKQKLLDIIGSMKVEVSYRKKLQELKARESKKQALNRQDGPDSEGTQRTTEDIQRGKPLNPELVKAASAVASSFPLNKKQTESELLAQLRRHEETTDKQRKGDTVNIRSFQNSHTMDGFVDISDILSGLVNFHDSSAELN